MRVAALPAFVRANLILLLAGLILGAGVGVSVERMGGRDYSAQATVMPSIYGGAEDGGGLMALTFEKRRLEEYAAVARTSSFLALAISNFGLKINPLELAKRMSVTSVKDSSLITIVVRSDSPKAATTEADALAEQLAQVIPEREQLLPMRATVIDHVPAGAPINKPGTMTSMIQYALVGLVLGLAVSLMRSYTPVAVSRSRRRVRREVAA